MREKVDDAANSTSHCVKHASARMRTWVAGVGRITWHVQATCISRQQEWGSPHACRGLSVNKSIKKCEAGVQRRYTHTDILSRTCTGQGHVRVLKVLKARMLFSRWMA